MWLILIKGAMNREDTLKIVINVTGTGRILEPLGQIVSCLILLGWLVFEENGISEGTSWKGIWTIGGCAFIVCVLYRAVVSKWGNLTSLLLCSPTVSVATGVSAENGVNESLETIIILNHLVFAV